jgi:spore coat protein U-like protein
MLKIKTKRVSALAAIFAVALNTSTNLEAAQSTDGFSVQLKRPTGCTIFVTDVDFGTVTSVTNGTTATGQIIGRCTTGTFMRLSFSATGASATSTTGTMAGATAGNTDTIPYRLQLSGCCAVGLGTNVPITGTITGTIRANVNATPDTYSQTRTLYMYF